jgi:GGDEF domain-containing protein
VLFAHLARRKHLVESRGPSVPGESGSRVFPRGFEPVADALLTKGDVDAAAIETGRNLAADGVSLDEAFTDLEATYRAVGLDEPDYRVVRGLGLSWTEVALRYLHGLSCDDPLTGLASLPHLRSRLDEVYREAERRGGLASAECALVVVETDQTSRRTDDGFVEQPSVEHSVARRFGSALRMAEVADALRAVFSGGETLARVGVRRAVALVRRRAELAAEVESLRQLLKSRSATSTDGGEQRVWIEGLPSSGDSASLLLDELAR